MKLVLVVLGIVALVVFVLGAAMAAWTVASIHWSGR